jgi:calcineurin-like phosphoesterase family protein
MKYFSSDWHLGHEGSIKFSNRPFANAEEMDRVIIQRMTAPIKKGDDFYFLGDLAWETKSAEMFFEAFPSKARFYWILGNHDKDKQRTCLNSKLKPFEKYCAFVGDLLEIKLSITPNDSRQDITLAHYPMITWNKSHYNAWQLFGHHHTHSWKHEEIPVRTHGKQLNVNCEFYDYQPLNEHTVIELMSRKPSNWDLISR